MATFLACNASAKLPILNRCWVRMRRLFLLLPVFLPVPVEKSWQGKNSVALINYIIHFSYQYFCFEIFFSRIFFKHSPKFFFFFTKTPSFFIIISLSNFRKLYVNWLKIVNFTRAIARIQMRPFQLKSGKKYSMLHGRKVDFTSCNFAALSSLVQHIWPSVTIAYFPHL